MRHLGIDYGHKRIGLALSDESGTMAFPKEVIATTSEAPAYIGELVSSEGIEKIVIGESRDYSGTPNPIMAAAHRFVEELRAATNASIVFEPEFMTSAQAARPFGGEYAPVASPAKMPKREVLDAAAAALILQNYLDRSKK